MVILHRGGALSAQAAYRERVTAHPKIDIRFNITVEEILGDAKVTGARTRDLVTGARADLDLTGVFIYIGMQPNTGFLDGRIALDPSGRIETDRWMRTELSRDFRGGIGALRLAGPGRDIGGRRGYGGARHRSLPEGRSLAGSVMGSDRWRTC